MNDCIKQKTSKTAHNVSETRNYKTSEWRTASRKRETLRRRMAHNVRSNLEIRSDGLLLLQSEEQSCWKMMTTKSKVAGRWWRLRWKLQNKLVDNSMVVLNYQRRRDWEMNIPRCHVGVVPPQKNTFEGRLYIEISIGCKYRVQYELDIRADVLERV